MQEPSCGDTTKSWLHEAVGAARRALALSFRPSLHSGMPLRKVRILRAPTTSDLTTVPLLLTSRFTVSTTSKKTCSPRASKSQC